ncbi:MAG TPA: mandelate racemase/muconate lactonizing enzyme family protein [Bryobacteraceae bacterium]|nr:mandelate racemase/muconate lactonizing enzyme family protein [Bryobacteraceae bacterium]
MDRRHLLQSLALAPAALAAPERQRVTITGLETFRLKVNRRGDWVLARLQTSAGVTGIGDASQGGADDAQTALLRQLFERLKGRGVFDLERVREELAPEIARQGRAAWAAFSALEQCVWDIRGKLCGLPLYDLLGGALRTSIRNYANINRSTDPRTPAGFAAMAERAVGAGFDAVKLAPFDGMPKGLREEARIARFMQEGLDCAAAVRQAIGPQRDLLIDVHSHFDRSHGLELARRFEPLHLFWLEEVTPAEPLEDLAAIRKAARMPTAGGESIHGIAGFYRYIRAEAVGIIMPDVKYCGGILELKKIASMAEGAGIPVAPHGPASPVGNFAAAHVCATLPNFHILEFSFGEVPWRAELTEPAEVLEHGRLALSGRPGLGIELNPKTLQKYRA